MSQKIDIKNFDEFMLNSSTSDNLKYLFPNNIGTFQSSKNIIHENIMMFKTDGKTNINSLLLDSSANISGLSIVINLEGSVNYIDNTSKSNYFFNKGEVIIKYINQYKGFMEFKESSNIKSLCLVIRNEFLEKYLLDSLKHKKEIQKKYNDNISIDLRKGVVSFKVLNLANELYNSPFLGVLDNLFLQSKAYEIIYEEFNNIINRQNNFCKNIFSCDKLNLDDIDALYKAKKLIEEAQEFYTLNDLCKKVALNEFKLKYGFKKLFNISPGAMILSLKMQKAKELLLTQKFNVSEVSKIIGYKHQQNFSTAFFKHFNISPKSLIKTKSYYDF